MRKEQQMNEINFEKDQEEILDRTENLTSLANQVKTLRALEDQIKANEELTLDFSAKQYHPELNFKENE